MKNNPTNPSLTRLDIATAGATPLREPVAPVAPVVPDVSKMSLSEIVRLIRRDWKKVYFGAVPYLSAMGAMEKVSDTYGADSPGEPVLYFLSNAQTWKGPIAKAVKAELNKRLKAIGK
jgi:hypothetical protein